MIATKRHAQSIADRHLPSEGYGVAEIVILILAKFAEYAIPKMIECWLESRQNVSASMSTEEKATALKTVATMNWVGNRYDDDFIYSMRNTTRSEMIRAIEEVEGCRLTRFGIKHDPRFHPQQLDIASAKLLDEARLGGDLTEVVTECLPEVATIDLSTIPD